MSGNTESREDELRALRRQVDELGQKLTEVRARAERFKQDQRRFFELLISGEPLGEVLTALVHMVSCGAWMSPACATTNGT